MPQLLNPHPIELQSTRWSLISRARQSDPEPRRQALGELLERYYPVLRSHLVVKKRLETHRADDLLQGFVSEKILERNFLDQADRTRGKFRSLLFRSLENFVVDQIRREKNFRAATLPGEGDGELLLDRGGDEAPADVFDVAWARQVLSEALHRMQVRCEHDHRPWLWPLFEGRIVRPTLLDQPPVSYEELVSAFGFESPAQASNALITVKRQFQRILESVVAEYLDETEDLAAELADLRRILSQAGPLDRDLSVGWVSSPPGIPTISKDKQVEILPHETTSMQLVGIFDVSPDASDHWSPEDLGALLRHQLAAPLRETLSADERVGRKLSPPSSAAGDDEPKTFADLFQHSDPPLELLNAVKRWSKHAARRTESSLPIEIGTTLYYASLAAALVRQQQRITSSDADTLRYGFEMMLQQSWLTEALRLLFEEARRVL